MYLCFGFQCFLQCVARRLREVRQIQSLMVIQCDNCKNTIPCCAACNETWVKRAWGWGPYDKRRKWACRECCDSWGDEYSLEKCRAEYLKDTSWVCGKCRPELPESLTAATSDTQPPTVTISGPAGGGGAEHSSSFADTTIVEERPVCKDAATSVSGDWLWHSHEHDPKDKHTPKWNWDGWDSNEWYSTDKWWWRDERWHWQGDDYSHG